MPSKLSLFMAELKRRRVYKVAGAYVAAGVAISVAVPDLFSAFDLPHAAARLVIILIAVGFPFALVLAWAYELRPEEPGAGEATTPGTTASVGVATLEATAGAAAHPADRRRLAVLPFSSFSPTRDDDYFADGVTEELTSVISRVSGLEVIARTSVMPYKAAPQPVSVIARELSVGSILEGSIRRAGNQVRVTVQLIDTSTEAHLWSEDYDRELSDVFTIQSDIARAVARALRIRLVTSEEQRIEKAPTADLEAHDLYLLGRHHLLQRNQDSLPRAIELFEGALAKDPSYALASAGLGEAYMWAGVGYVRNPPADALSRARAAAETAVRLDANLAEANVALGVVANMQVDLVAAWPALQRAISLNPSSAPAYQALAYFWIMRADFDEQLRCIERAMELDPRSANIRLEAGWPHLYASRYEPFRQRCREALELDPSYALAYFNLGSANEFLGDLEGALAAYERALELGGIWGMVKGHMVRALVKSGDVEGARRVVAEVLARSEEEGGLALPLAVAYDALGDAEASVSWVERAYAQGEPAARWLHLEGFLRFENTRTHPRFQAFLAEEDRRLGR